MMDAQDQLLAEVEAFLIKRKMSATEFGIAAVNSGHFVRNLRSGSNMKMETIRKVWKYLETEAGGGRGSD